MKTFFLLLFVLLNFSQYQCETPTCQSNCTASGECWEASLTYRSSELIEQLFSFSSLSVHVDHFQRKHTNEMNDSILFINKALENHLSNESIDSNLTMNLFNETKQILIDYCKNLTLTPVETIDLLPPLVCSLSTCSSEKINFMVLLIISILITSLIFLICVIESFQTHRRIRPKNIRQIPISFSNSYGTITPIINYRSNRF